ncbi:hypothetical protein EV700_0810 [Fluviicoccus keumensis]|uniref:Uncharacterized protein n=1 Tax=Fluviicoccus keumensis TaxID=1435465 RepID=A0A4Q7ZCU7_9GAMM|nr:hypothetical protein [Fluviicoccus keumensis]RZU47843.1 hypothetical protein EV700_0810 [Fluviicoccus keumensis]
MNKRRQAILAVVLAVPLIGGVLWLGASGEGGHWSLVRENPDFGRQMAQVATPSAPVSVDAAAPAAKPAEPAAAPAPVPLTPERRRFILGEFVKAAEKDIARVESDLTAARNDGAPADQIAGKEEQLRNMKQILQRTLERNAGV